jgi:hypothetical protein
MASKKSGKQERGRLQLDGLAGGHRPGAAPAAATGARERGRPATADRTRKAIMARIPADLWRRVKLHRAATDAKLEDIVRDALEAYLSAHAK